jgi:hypothetical protein
MGVITREDLKYTYNWTTEDGDDPEVTGKPDKDRLDRSEGYEVIDFINSFCKTYGLTTKDEAIEIERLLHKGVPSKMVMKDDIKEWLVEELNLEK